LLHESHAFREVISVYNIIYTIIYKRKYLSRGSEKWKVNGNFGISGKKELKGEIVARKTEERKIILKDSIFADDL